MKVGGRPPVLFALVTLMALASPGTTRASDVVPTEARPRVTAGYGKLPLHFEANQGQTDRLTPLDTAGAVVTTFDVSLPAGQTVGTNTASLGVTRNRTGTAKFTHDGPPGAMVVESAIANFTISPAYVQPVKFQAVREGR